MRCNHCSILALSDVLKLNEDELPIVLRAASINQFSAAEPGMDQVAQLQALRAKYGLKLVALTQGSRGATLVTETEASHCEPPQVTIRDTVGAGDAYTAAMVIGWMRGWPLRDINSEPLQWPLMCVLRAGPRRTCPMS